MRLHKDSGHIMLLIKPTKKMSPARWPWDFEGLSSLLLRRPFMDFLTTAILHL